MLSLVTYLYLQIFFSSISSPYSTASALLLSLSIFLPLFSHFAITFIHPVLISNKPMISSIYVFTL